MKDSLEICDLWEIVTGIEERPGVRYPDEDKDWKYRERIARVMIKNSLGAMDYHQVKSAETAAEVWNILMNLHQATGAQGKVDLIWKFWNSRCEEGDSVRKYIGDVRAIHSELAECGIIIEDYLLAILLSKSLPPSYDNYVASIFAGISDLENANSSHVANKIFEEEIRQNSRSEDAHVASTQRVCHNCGKPGHFKAECYNKGGGREGQAPWQIARKKKQEADRKKESDSKVEESGQTVQIADQDTFLSSHMALDDGSSKYKNFSSYSWSNDAWIADSGASAHIANRREMFHNFKPCKRVLNVAGGLTTPIEGTGEFYMRGMVDGHCKDFRLVNVLYVPTTRFCLISGSKIDKAGGKTEYGNSQCKFQDNKGNVIATGVLEGNLYRMNAKALVNHTHSASTLR